MFCKCSTVKPLFTGPLGEGRWSGKSRDTVNRGTVDRGFTVVGNIGGRGECPVIVNQGGTVNRGFTVSC